MSCMGCSCRSSLPVLHARHAGTIRMRGRQNEHARAMSRFNNLMKRKCPHACGNGAGCRSTSQEGRLHIGTLAVSASPFAMNCSPASRRHGTGRPFCGHALLQQGPAAPTTKTTSPLLMPVQCSSWQDGRRPPKGLDDRTSAKRKHMMTASCKGGNRNEPYLGTVHSTSRVTCLKEGLAGQAHPSQPRANKSISSGKGCGTSCASCLLVTLAPEALSCSSKQCRPHTAHGAFLKISGPEAFPLPACAPGLGIEASRPKSR